MPETARHLTAADVEHQYGQIRGAVVQSWLSMLILYALGFVFLGLPALFGTLAVIHTVGTPFLLAYARRWRDRLLEEIRS
jgi:hypothetical protein